MSKYDAGGRLGKPVVIDVVLELDTDKVTGPSVTVGPEPRLWPAMTSWLVVPLTVTCVIVETVPKAVRGRNKAAMAANNALRGKDRSSGAFMIYNIGLNKLRAGWRRSANGTMCLENASHQLWQRGYAQAPCGTSAQRGKRCESRTALMWSGKIFKL